MALQQTEAEQQPRVAAGGDGRPFTLASDAENDAALVCVKMSVSRWLKSRQTRISRDGLDRPWPKKSDNRDHVQVLSGCGQRNRLPHRWASGGQPNVAAGPAMIALNRGASIAQTRRQVGAASINRKFEADMAILTQAQHLNARPRRSRQDDKDNKQELGQQAQHQSLNIRTKTLWQRGIGRTRCPSPIAITGLGHRLINRIQILAAASFIRAR